MTDTSARFAFPFILPGQAQKEAYHNEALTVLDAALHAAVEEDPLADPPSDPEPGQSWIVGDEATGAWSGKDGSLATWTSGGWRLVAPVAGMMVWHKAIGCWVHWTGGGWSDGSLPAAAIVIDGDQIIGPRLPDVPNPSGGTTIDAEARAAVDAVIATLRSHGLINS
ncbi:MAG: hypothetical protein QOH47_143 [Sphingomonadales bacterium]|jgi:hypothetical protein|nr:hypothetical protein [Sphingomonadales bacterium]